MYALLFASALIPALFVLAALIAHRDPGARPKAALRATRLASLAAFGLSLLAAIGLLAFGPASSALLGWNGIGLQIRLDALSVTMLVLVTFIGAVVLQFSRTYLDGDARHGAFMGGLAWVMAAVTLFTLSGNLGQLVLAWIATSLSLHRLLIFYGDRPAARLAAFKKAIVARIGDTALIGAALLLVTAFGTGDLAVIAAQAQTMEGTTGAITAATLLIALAALLKSAVFPTQSWLTEVMETPTPVSALLHAGVINAGGFLVLRLADVMILSLPALIVLAVLGAISALVGGLVMATQTSVKVTLAWSTVAQMGFMLLQCGLGSFTSAALHIVAHSLYKAHAFLSTGDVASTARLTRQARQVVPGWATIAGALAVSVAMVLIIGLAFGVTFEAKPAILALGAILAIGLTHLLATSAQGSELVLRAALASAGMAALYFALQLGAEHLLAGTMPLAPAFDPLKGAIMAPAVLGFAALAILQLHAPNLAASAQWMRVAGTVRAGFHSSAGFNRLARSLKSKSKVMS